MEGCLVTAACLESLSGFHSFKYLAFLLIILNPWLKSNLAPFIAELPSLQSLNLNRSMLSDDGCEKFARMLY